jgi:benzodiazapine receptor
MKKTILAIIISIIIAQLAGAIGSIFTASNIETWYVFLEKPSFAPPSWLFAPAWITLYTLMGIAAFLVWQKREMAKAKSALYFYFTQLLLNAIWSIAFFGLQSPFLGFLVIIILWLLILITLVKFWKIRSLAGVLFIPYIIWVSFAAVLNFAVWQLNA